MKALGQRYGWTQAGMQLSHFSDELARTVRDLIDEAVPGIERASACVRCEKASGQFVQREAQRLVSGGAFKVISSSNSRCSALELTRGNSDNQRRELRQ